jgi:hypothetical protein
MSNLSKWFHSVEYIAHSRNKARLKGPEIVNKELDIVILFD